MFWEPKNVFYGHDMSKWDYLGFVNVTWVGNKYPVFFFKHKTKNLRSYYADPFLQKHGRINLHKSRLEAQKKGLFPIYYLIEIPSSFLHDMMEKENGWVWSNKEKWWVDAPQKIEISHANTANVISVDFSAKNIDG